ncbi:hypothetical protein ACFL9S_08025 [Erwinia sp. AnSW2-5]|uniref:hypothetical protein n=1 Tax=Erwinia sp. AnSW2-5 TaxID=3367692 RepID=UPI00385AC7F1
MIFITKKMHQRGEFGTKLAPNKSGECFSFALSAGITDKKKARTFMGGGPFLRVNLNPYPK